MGEDFSMKGDVSIEDSKTKKYIPIWPAYFWLDHKGWGVVVLDVAYEVIAREGYDIKLEGIIIGTDTETHKKLDKELQKESDRTYVVVTKVLGNE